MHLKKIVLGAGHLWTSEAYAIAMAVWQAAWQAAEEEVKARLRRRRRHATVGIGTPMRSIVTVDGSHIALSRHAPSSEKEKEKEEFHLEIDGCATRVLSRSDLVMLIRDARALLDEWS